jgi:hypothetical protein
MSAVLMFIYWPHKKCHWYFSVIIHIIIISDGTKKCQVVLYINISRLSFGCKLHMGWIQYELDRYYFRGTVYTTKTFTSYNRQTIL